MIRATLIVLSLLSLFMFPWQMTLLLGFAASLYVPPFALLLGVLAEVLYRAGGVPYALIAGLLGFVVASFVRLFVKTRIIEL